MKNKNDSITPRQWLIFCLLVLWCFFHAIGASGQTVTSKGKKYELKPDGTYIVLADSTRVQCAGMTKAGKQCSRLIKIPAQYCWQHKTK